MYCLKLPSSLQGLQGEIKHLYRSFAFLSSKMVIENGGIIVCRTKHLALAGGGKVRNDRTFSLLALSSNRDQLCLGDGRSKMLVGEGWGRK